MAQFHSSLCWNKFNNRNNNKSLVFLEGVHVSCCFSCQSWKVDLCASDIWFWWLLDAVLHVDISYSNCSENSWCPLTAAHIRQRLKKKWDNTDSTVGRLDVYFQLMMVELEEEDLVFGSFANLSQRDCNCFPTDGVETCPYTTRFTPSWTSQPVLPERASKTIIKLYRVV